VTASLLAVQRPTSLVGCGRAAVLLAEGHQYGTLETLLSGAVDIPEDDLAVLTRRLLSRPDAATKHAQQAYFAGLRTRAEAAVALAEKAAAASGDTAAAALHRALAAARIAAATVEGFSPAQAALHPLLAARHDPGILTAALRRLSSAQAVSLLRYLHIWLRNHARLPADALALASENSAAGDGVVVAPTPQAVLDWICSTLDANLARLASNASAAPALVEARRTVHHQVDAMRGLSRVKGAIEHLQCGAPLPMPPAASGRYAVELLDLRVF
jgi:hypothetical protein